MSHFSDKVHMGLTIFYIFVYFLIIKVSYTFLITLQCTVTFFSIIEKLRLWSWIFLDVSGFSTHSLPRVCDQEYCRNKLCRILNCYSTLIRRPITTLRLQLTYWGGPSKWLLVFSQNQSNRGTRQPRLQGRPGYLLTTKSLVAKDEILVA